MTRRINATLLGLFILGALVIFMLGVSQFGRDALLGRGEKFVMFFDGTMKGLQVGSPVTYRGLKIGEVTGVRLQYIEETDQIEVPVYIQFVQSEASEESTVVIEHLISKGLRGQLQLHSLLSGELGVEVGFHPDTAVILRGLDEKHLEIPTISATPGAQEMLRETLENANITLERISDFVTSDELEEALQILKQSLYSFDATMTGAQGLILNADDNLEPLVVSIQDALESFIVASRSFRTLTEYLAQHPESLLTGKN